MTKEKVKEKKIQRSMYIDEEDYDLLRIELMKDKRTVSEFFSSSVDLYLKQKGYESK